MKPYDLTNPRVRELLDRRHILHHVVIPKSPEPLLPGQDAAVLTWAQQEALGELMTVDQELTEIHAE